MFRSARIKLTAWYLLIIIIISGTLSLIIFRQTTADLQRRFGTIERRFLSEQRPLPGRMPPHLRLLSLEFNEAKRQLIARIIFANGIIVLVSATAAYFLAGQTLRPIERASDEQRRFIADASHELRTPLTALKTSIEVALRDKKMTVKAARGVLESNLDEVDNLQSLATSLLTLAEHQRPDASTAFETIDLGEIVQDAMKRINPLAKEKDLAVNVLAESVPLEANRAALEELLVNFLDNAIKYTPPDGEIRFLASHDAKNAYIKIADTGVGIYEVDLPHIFDRFYKVDKSRSKSKTPGFGLGLPIAKRLIDLHKGTVDVTSTPGQGTTFTITLPLRRQRS